MSVSDTAAVAALFLALPVLVPIAILVRIWWRWRLRPGTLRDGRFALRFERRR